MAASHPKVGKALFEMGVTSSCEFEKHQYFTTHLHIAPEDELIYLGGLPPVSTRLRTTACAHAACTDGVVVAPDAGPRPHAQP